MNRTPIALLLLLPLLLAAAGAAGSSAEVTADSLPGLERYWPYRVTLVDAWQPPGRAAPLRAGTQGILIRVETPALARVDFSSQGKLDVPVAATDLVQNAERIRRGALAKASPNFTLAIGNRLVDSASETLSGFDPMKMGDPPGYLCVFVDPDAPGFDSLAAALAPLRDRHQVMTILFPQGARPDAATRERLRALGWTVPFVYDFLSEAYTSTLLADGTPMPQLLLQTNEGRVLLQERWSPDVVPRLTAALDAAFGGAAHADEEGAR